MHWKLQERKTKILIEVPWCFLICRQLSVFCLSWVISMITVQRRFPNKFDREPTKNVTYNWCNFFNKADAFSRDNPDNRPKTEAEVNELWALFPSSPRKNRETTENYVDYIPEYKKLKIWKLQIPFIATSNGSRHIFLLPSLVAWRQWNIYSQIFSGIKPISVSPTMLTSIMPKSREQKSISSDWRYEEQTKLNVPRAVQKLYSSLYLFWTYCVLCRLETSRKFLQIFKENGVCDLIF